MQFTPDSNQIPKPTQDTDARMRKLRVWKLENGVTWEDMAKHMLGLATGKPITGNAVHKALRGSRIPTKHHKALLAAYPNLPKDLLPVPLDVLPGPKPSYASELEQRA